MKKGLYVLAAVACLLLSACSKEGIDSVAGQSAGATREVKMSLGAGIQLFGRDEISEDEAGGFKALEEQRLLFEIRDGNNKFILGDNGQPILDDNNAKVPSKRGYIETEDLKGKAANIKFFVQVRKKNTTTIVGKLYQKWDYQSRNTTDWRLNGVNIPLTGVTPGTDELQVRVVAGGNLDADQGKIFIPKPEYKVIDLSTTNKVSLPVPFVSDWIDLRYDGAQYTTVGDAKIKLKPLGVLLVTTVRSSMAQPTSLTGIRYVTNALAFQGEFTLDGSNNVPFTAIGGRKFETEITEDNYYEVTYNFPEAVTPGRAPSDKVIVAWGLPTGKPKAEEWDTKTNSTGDASRMISMPQTHAYAVGVSNPGHTNFKVVAVMGTNHNFVHGKSSAINCELYDVPRQILGFFPQYTVNAQGDGFDTSHEPDQVSLVNWKVAKEFLNGKELTGPNGQKATYKIGSTAMASFLGSFFGTFAWSQNNAGQYYRLLDQQDPTKGAVSARNVRLLYNSGTGDDFVYNEANLSMMVVYIPKKNPNANYSIIGRFMGKNATAKDRTLSKDQFVMKTEATLPNGIGKYPVGSKTLTSVALGKYFIGSAYSPIYNNKCAYDEELWTDNTFLQGRVQRKFPAAGNYQKSSWKADNPTVVADVDNIYPDNKTRDNVGQSHIYWYRQAQGDSYGGPARMMAYLFSGIHGRDKSVNVAARNGADWIADELIWGPGNKSQSVFFVPGATNGNLFQAPRDAKYMWEALWPIASKYQGDNIDPD